MFVEVGDVGASLVGQVEGCRHRPCCSFQAAPLCLLPSPALPWHSPTMSLCDGANSLLPCESLPSLNGEGQA